MSLHVILQNFLTEFQDDVYFLGLTNFNINLPIFKRNPNIYGINSLKLERFILKFVSPKKSHHPEILLKNSGALHAGTP